MKQEQTVGGKIILVTGGSRSGKSEFAEELLKKQEEVMYIATAIVTDEEMRSRIEKHRERRNQNWVTYEGFEALDVAIGNCKFPFIMLDCVTVMITNLLFKEERDFDHMTRIEVEILQQEIKAEFDKMIRKIRAENKTAVLVTNEVGSGLVPEYKLGRIFRDIAGYMNQQIANQSDEVYLVACGLPLKLK